jgi:hypothetical protein
MKPKDIIAALKSGTIGKPGRIIFAQPLTNLPVGDSDYRAAQVMEFILEKVLPEKATLEDVLILLAEIQWWMVFFASLSDARPFEPQNQADTNDNSHI